MWKTVLLLIGSNSFMTYAWYGHLKHRNWPLGGSKRTRVVTGQLLATLLQMEGRIAASGVCVDIEDPGSGEIGRKQQGGEQRCYE